VSDQVLGVIDVGSNSGRIVVLRIGAQGHLEILAASRAPLRLALEVQRTSRITRETIERTAATLRDFRSIAESSGATRTIAVATSAVRESRNAQELLDHIRSESGIDVEVIDGDIEARYAFRGAVHGLEASAGLVMDIGGGSVEVVRFEGRRETGWCTLPLGALRVSDRFLRSDPPTVQEIESLREHALEVLQGAGLDPLQEDGWLVGTGGTIRNLAKIDRQTRTYPIARLHGYVLTRKRAQDVADRVATRPRTRRRSIPGLSRYRADSIVGGSVVALALMELVGASRVLVSGQGLREGIALEHVSSPPSPMGERPEASVRGLASRFSAWDPDRAARRTAIAAKLQEGLWPEAEGESGERLRHAATLLDVGRSIDYYRRHQHAADVVTEADLAGFSHRELALLAAVIRTAGEESSRWQAYRPLLGAEDRDPVARAAAILALADEAERRMPPGPPESISLEQRRKTIVLHVPVVDPWRQEALARRCTKVFGKRFVFDPVATAVR
jgi:exopolyphosphatase / guanosine-5'-triphosphate,3'-diphosphate pyrophosphatase